MLALIASLNADPAIHGVLVQLPLPAGLSPARVVEAIAPEKDVDGLHPVNAGLIATGAIERAIVPCTPAGAMVMIDKACEALGRKLDGLEAVVVGRSNLVGKPIAQLLLARNCTVTIAHSRTRDLPAVARRADVLVAAVGRPEMVRGDWIKPGAIVIDVGINRVAAPEKGEGKTRLVGDVAYAEAAARAGAITPVPGGVGRMTVAMLMANTLAAAERAARAEPGRRAAARQASAIILRRRFRRRLGPTFGSRVRLEATEAGVRRWRKGPRSSPSSADFATFRACERCASRDDRAAKARSGCWLAVLRESAGGSTAPLCAAWSRKRAAAPAAAALPPAPVAPRAPRRPPIAARRRTVSPPGSQGFKQEAEIAGLPPAVIDSALSDVAYDPDVIAHDRRQGSFGQDFDKFVAKRVSAYRVRKGRQMLIAYAEPLEKIERRFGVPGPVLVAIWGLETEFGAGLGNYPTFNALATLAYDCRRADQFREELVDALKLVARGDMQPEEMRGAWAGEIGQTQFMPSTYLKYATSADGGRVADLIGNSKDALASTANYLRAKGWKRGEGWHEGEPNFASLLEWNRADVYAKTIGYFADRLASEDQP